MVRVRPGPESYRQPGYEPAAARTTLLRYRRLPGPVRPGLREVAVGLTLEIVGQAPKRRLVPRGPTGDRILTEIEAWLRTDGSEFARGTRRSDPVSGDPTLAVALHPAASEVVIRASKDGRVVVSAVTSPVGPGYHTYVCSLIERLGGELGIAWQPVGVPDGSRDDAGAFEAGERPGGRRAAAERAHLAWLGRTLGSVQQARRSGARGIHVGTPVGVRYAFEGALATVLGPRDDGWLERALADPRTAIDVLPWWADATDGRYLLNRALCLMWTEVRWRPPGLDGERELLDEIAHLLWHAYPLDPALPFPWREWQEILVLRGVDDPASRMVAERAAGPGQDRPPFGYRREPVTIVHAGWALPIPGSFGERRSDEEWWGGEGGRAVTLAGVETGTARGPMTADEFLDQVSGDLGMHALAHAAGPVKSRARLTTDGSSGVDVGVLDGYAAIAGRGAAIRVEFADPADYQWALDTWRGLSPA